VLAGGGGIDLTDDLPSRPDIRSQFAIPAGVPLVINPRGARPYVRTDTFLEAVRLVHETDPSIMFLGVGLQGWASAEQYVANHGLEKTLLLTSHLDRATLLGLMRTADISVSLAEHDGTPNTLLEAMYSGSFPICGDLPSIREWITSGKNGILVAPSDARQVAHSILDGIRNLSLRKEAVVMNRELIRTRADRDATREQAETLYRKLAAGDSDASDKGKRNGAAIT
jgi:glycosyltransferase involved in cell wall biosynthesis